MSKPLSVLVPIAVLEIMAEATSKTVALEIAELLTLSPKGAARIVAEREASRAVLVGAAVDLASEQFGACRPIDFIRALTLLLDESAE